MARMPAFKLPSSDGDTVSSAGLKGRPYLLYAYPKDLTPGCTTEACDFRDNLARLETLGVQVFGLSPDPVAKHETFIAKHELSFPLLADEEKVLLEKLGIWVEKSMYGRTYMGVERSTFLVGADGRILREWRKVKVSGHVEEVIAAASELLQ